METFGEKIRQAVESLDLPLEDISRATGIDVDHLRALGDDDLGAVPDAPSVVEGLRALARLVGVSPGEVIEDYLRCRRESKVDSADSSIRPPATEPAPPAASQEADVVSVDPDPTSRASRAIGIFATTFAVLAVCVLGISVKMLTSKPRESASRGDSARDDAPRGEAREPQEQTKRVVSPGLDLPAGDPVGDAAPTAPRAVVDGPRSVPEDVPPDASEPVERPSGMTISEYGIGSAVVNHRLVKEARRFPEGGQVWFWTRVEGGTPGDTIHHVWLHEGEEILRMPLTIGGAHWRTYTSKTLHPGSAGGWVVEARDASERLLARREFTCYERP